MGLFDKKEDNKFPTGTTSAAPVSSVDNCPGVMPIKNVLGSSYCCIVTGSITEGSFCVGDDVTIFHVNGSTTNTAIVSIESGVMKKFDIISKGQHAFIQLNGLAKSAVQPGAVLKKK